MVPLLKRYHYNYMLPELVDPRHTRNMKIRDPEYIKTAQKQLQIKTKKILKTI